MILNKALRMVLALVFSIASLSVTALAAPVTDESPPYPLPTQYPFDPNDEYVAAHFLPPAEGLQDAAGRVFREQDSMIQMATFAVYTFDTAPHAQAAVPILAERTAIGMQEAMPNTPDPVPVDSVAPAGFDAFATIMVPVEWFTASIAVGSVDTTVYMATYNGPVTGEFNQEVLDWMTTLYLNPTDRGPGSESEPTWGIWGLLPTEADLAPRFILPTDFQSNGVPMDLGPVVSNTAIDTGVAAQEPPYALPTQMSADAAKFGPPLDGVQDSAFRWFVYPVSDSQVFSKQFGVIQFDTAEHAQAALPEVETRYAKGLQATMPEGGTGPDHMDVAAPAGFDTFSVTLMTMPQASTTVAMGTIDNVLYIASSDRPDLAFDSDVVSWMQQFYLDPADRGPGSATEPTVGIWGLLPTEHEVNGTRFILNDNWVPVFFGPMPAAATPVP